VMAFLRVTARESQASPARSGRVTKTTNSRSRPGPRNLADVLSRPRCYRGRVMRAAMTTTPESVPAR
ncbi:MAG: hypothetical protein ACRDP5_17015, partial [Streptosporangiaceae bacterium]